MSLVDVMEMRNEDSAPWQTDEHGKRYRMIGNIKEYEPEIMTTAGILPKSIAQNLMNNRAKQEAPKPQSKPSYDCPFSSGINTACKGDKCTLFTGGSCALEKKKTGEEVRQLETQCFLNSYRCSTSCVLYNGKGCGILDLVKKGA